MANWATLKEAIANIIKTNGNQEITGAVLQNTLNSIVNSVGENATFAGIAIPTTNPGAPDGPVFYLAAEAGNYVNFDGISIEAPGLIVLYNNSNNSWLYKMAFSISQKLGDDDKISISQKVTTLEISKLSPTICSNNNLFNIKDVTHDKAVSQHGNIIDWPSGVISRFYIIPADCKIIKVYSNNAASSAAYCRFSDTIDATPTNVKVVALNKNAETVVQVTDEIRALPFFCAWVFRPSASEEPNLDGVYVKFLSGSEIDGLALTEKVNNLETFVDDMSADVETLKNSYKELREKHGFSDVFVNNNTDEELSTLDNLYQGVSRRQIYESILSAKFYKCDPSVKRTLYVVWNKEGLLNIRISAYISDAWKQEFVYNNEAINPTEKAILNISMDNGNGGTAYLTVNTSLIPSNRNSIFNQLTAEPELIFSRVCYDDATDVIDVIDAKVDILSNYLEKPLDYSALIYQGFISLSTGALSSHDRYKSTDYIRVSGGDKISIKASTGNTQTVANVAFYDANKQYLNSYKQTTQSDIIYSFDIPKNCSFIRCCCYDTSNDGEGYKIFSLSPSEINLNVLAQNVNVLTEKVNNLETAVGGSNIQRLYPRTKLPVISFEFDDNHPNDSKIVEIFNRYNLTCSFAFVGNASNISRYGETYKKWQDLGYEVLNHSLDGSTFGNKIFTITDVNISGGSGTIKGTFSDSINQNYPELLVGTITKRTGDGDETIQFNGMSKSSNEYTLNVTGVSTNPLVGDTYTYVYTYELATKLICTAKNNLEAAGFIINGFVSPSSTMAPSLMPILEALHSFAFTYSVAATSTTDDKNSREANTCDLHRCSMQSYTLDQLKAFIDKQIELDNCITLYAHSADWGNTITEEKLTGLLDYVIEKRNSLKCFIGNTTDCIKYYFDM